MQNGVAIAANYNQTPLFAGSASANLSAVNSMSNNAVSQKAIHGNQLWSNVILQQINAQNNPALNMFMNTMQNNNIGLLYNVDSIIHCAETKTIHIAVAQAANAAITPTNKVEQSQKTFNGLYLSYLAQFKQLSVGEITNLENIALLCPMYYGTAVYQARAVLFDLKRQTYMSECEKVSPPSLSSKRIRHDDTNGGGLADIKIYPNPAANEVFIDAADYATVEVSLYNTMGELVIEKTVVTTGSLNLGELPNGMYVYKVISNNAQIKVGKLIISK